MNVNIVKRLFIVLANYLPVCQLAILSVLSRKCRSSFTAGGGETIYNSDYCWILELFDTYFNTNISLKAV